MGIPEYAGRPRAGDDYLSSMAASPWLLRVYATLRRWADAGWANSVVLGWGLAQGCVFPGLADIVFLPLALTRPEKAYRLALVAAAGTIIGSVVLYVAGAEALEVLQGPLARLFGLTPEAFTTYRERLAAYGALAIFASTMSPLSTKLTSIASGAVGVAFPEFFLALLAGRLTRTLGLAWLVRHGGADAVARWVEVPVTPPAVERP
jgi:membrane protein YqaA with SNARE-associated domain